MICLSLQGLPLPPHTPCKRRTHMAPNHAFEVKSLHPAHTSGDGNSALPLEGRGDREFWDVFLKPPHGQECFNRQCSCLGPACPCPLSLPTPYSSGQPSLQEPPASATAPVTPSAPCFPPFLATPPTKATQPVGFASFPPFGSTATCLRCHRRPVLAKWCPAAPCTSLSNWEAAAPQTSLCTHVTDHP